MANLVIKFSVFAFLELAFWTRFRIFETVDSLNGFVVFTVKSPVLFMEPDSTSSPSFISFGSDSPVSADTSSVDFPVWTMPSSGTFSPAFMTISPPTATSSYTITNPNPP